MRAQFGRKRNATNQEKEGTQRVRCKHEKGRYAESFVDSANGQIDEGEHGEDCDEHAVVDDGWATADSFMDHVPGERHDEQGPEELGSKLAMRKGLAYSWRLLGAYL